MAKEMESKYVLTAEDRMRMAFESAQRRFQSLDRMAGKVGITLGGAFSVMAITAWLGKVAEAEKSENRLTAVINAQGHAAGFTRKQLEKMNDELVETSQFDDDAIREGQAQLLKFGNIYNDVFKRALKASADLAAFQGTELSAGIETVGKALQNPALGMKQLEQQIGKLDPAQKEIIKNLVEQNRVVEAQNKLLDILEGKIGGAAQEINRGYAKSLSDIAKSWDDLLEAAGKAGPVQTTAQSFLGFVNQSLKDMKSIIESGDWFGGLVFLLGGRGHDLTAQSKMALEIETVRKNLNDQRRKAAETIGDPAFAKNAAELQQKLTRMEAEYTRLYLTPEKAAPAPKAKIEGGDEEAAKRRREKLLQEEIQFGEDMRRMHEKRIMDNIAADIEAGEDMKALRDGYNEDRLRDEIQFGAHMRALYEANEDKKYDAMVKAGEREREERKRAAEEAIRAAQSATDYLANIRLETDAMQLNARQRMHLVDTFNLEQMGLQRGTAEWDAYVEAITAARDQQERLNESWAFGAQRALRDYLDEVRDVAGATSRLFSNGLRSMEDALTDFTMTGKFRWRDMVESFIADIARMNVQQNITGPLAAAAGQVLGGIFGGGGKTGGDLAFASGGSFTVGGAGGTDSKRVSFWATPGERVTVQTPAQQRAGGGPTVMIDARGADREGLARVERLVRELGGTIEQRAVNAVKAAKSRGALR